MDYKIFGCKVNKYYLNKWLNHFGNKKKNNDKELIIATCVVTDRAKSKFIKETIKQINNYNKIYLTGCAVFDKGQKMSEQKFYENYPELKIYQNKLELLSEEPNRLDTRGVASHVFKETTNIYTKKFIVIQNGCDNYCSFCLTIHKRGKSHNIDENKIVQEINDFVEIGGKEIVLTGINLAARGSKNTKKPQENKFADLLQQIINQTQIERIRISSLGPEFLNDKFFEIIKNTRFLPHFHISIQSFSDKVLKLMNRNYDSKVLDYVLNKFKNLDRPDQDQISIGADIIVGFPGETKEDFLETLNGIKKYAINKVHAFPFSAHDKGEAIAVNAFPNQVKQETKKERERNLSKISAKIREDFIAKNKGKEHFVLIEEFKNGKRRGWTGNYIQVELDGDYNKGGIVTLRL